MGYGFKCSPKTNIVVTSNTSVTEEGKFALDAVQNNPNVDGTIAKRIGTVETNMSPIQSNAVFKHGYITGASIIEYHNHICTFSLVISKGAGDFSELAEFPIKPNTTFHPHVQVYNDTKMYLATISSLDGVLSITNVNNSNISAALTNIYIDGSFYYE